MPAPLAADEIAQLPTDADELAQAIAACLSSRWASSSFAVWARRGGAIPYGVEWHHGPLMRSVRQILSPLSGTWAFTRGLPGRQWHHASSVILDPLGLRLPRPIEVDEGRIVRLPVMSPLWALPYGGEPLLDVLDAVANGEPAPQVLAGDTGPWLASDDPVIRLAGLRLLRPPA